MPDSRYFAKMGGALFLGLIALMVAFISFVFLLPFIIPLALGAFIIILVFLGLWAIAYAAILVGVGIYYFVKHPMKWEKEDKGYTIDKAKEAGMREKGTNKKKQAKKK